MSSPEPKSFFSLNDDNQIKTALFVSGSGTNAEKILEHWQANKDSLAYEPVCIVTDRPSRSNAAVIAKTFGISLVSLDIFEFYEIFLKNSHKRPAFWEKNSDSPN